MLPKFIVFQMYMYEIYTSILILFLDQGAVRIPLYVGLQHRHLMTEMRLKCMKWNVWN